MEEKAGLIWHKIITKYTQPNYPEKAVYLKDIDKTLSIFFRCMGGPLNKLIKSSDLKEFKGKSKFIYALAGVGKQFSIAETNNDYIYLPNKIDIFNSKELNKRLYLWQTIMAVYFAKNTYKNTNWAQANLNATNLILQKYPNLLNDYNQMLTIIIDSRQSYKSKKQTKESDFIQLFNNFPYQTNLEKTKDILSSDLLPFPLWVYKSKPSQQINTENQSENKNKKQNNKQKQEIKSQKKANKLDDDSSDSDGLMILLPEAVNAWEEHVKVDRTQDDDFDDNSAFIANNIEEMTIGNKTEGLSSRLKVDLDLPSSDADDYPVGKGILLDEWSYKKNTYLKDYCLLQPLLARKSDDYKIPKHLQALINKLKAQLNIFVINQYKQKKQREGQEINIDAWIEYKVAPNKSSDFQFYDNTKKYSRDLSTLILADLSLSTETFIENDLQVIDVIRDSLLIFSESINTIGDSFAAYGFSSVKNKMIRYHIFKNFNENYNDNIIQRINQIKPGFYTRLGAAIRQSVSILEKEKNPNKLLLILSDGKPNDIDKYEGKYGIEDTKKAIIEAKEKGITPFCVTIDNNSHHYLNYIFGESGYAIVKNSKKLPETLPSIYLNLTK